jgi:prepilin-type N-terminal cleavage/methylation domain-containing protein
MKRHITSSLRRAFTLVELLLAVFLLAIGLLGLLSIFPIGADWTRQITEDSIAQNVARNALGVIQAHYGPNGEQAGLISAQINSPNLTTLPQFTKIPAGERAYHYGAAVPFPAQNPKAATYFWTALIRLCPDQTTGGPNSRYDLYILVMKKGSVDDTYTATPPNTPTLSSTMTFVTGCRKDDGTEDYIPALVQDTYFRAAKNAGEYINTTVRNTPQIGDYGVGAQSGTAFRVYSDPANILMRPQIKGTVGTAGVIPPAVGADSFEPVLWIPPSDPMSRSSDDATPSPLVFIYQVTVTF